MLSGQVAMPWSVSGVTMAPSRMPISTRHTRVTGAGTCIGRPASAAMETASTEPEMMPAGIPSMAKLTPPAAAIASVSAVCNRSRGEGKEGSMLPRSMPRADGCVK